MPLLTLIFLQKNVLQPSISPPQGGGGLSRAVTAIQDPAFVYHILSNLCNFEDSANSGYKVENGIFVIPLQWQDTHFELKVFNPFSVITSVTAKYSDEFGIGESLGDDTFSKDGLVWIPTNLETGETNFQMNHQL